MRIEKSVPYTLKVQINDDVWEQPIVSGEYYIQIKKNSDGILGEGSDWVTQSGNYLELDHIFNGLWGYGLNQDATYEEGQYTAFFYNDWNPRLYVSLDVSIVQTLNYWSVTGE